MPQEPISSKPQKDGRRRTIPFMCSIGTPLTAEEETYLAAALLIGARSAALVYRIWDLPPVLTTAMKQLRDLEDSDEGLSSKRVAKVLARVGRTLLKFLWLISTHDWIFVFSRQTEMYRRTISETGWNNLTLMQGYALEVLGTIANWPEHYPVQPDPALRKLICEAHPYDGRLLRESDITQLHRLIRDFALALKDYAAHVKRASAA
jgi:hypothetical protein